MSERSSRASEALVAIVLSLSLAACGRSGDKARQGEPLRVAAAADLALAFKDVGAAFEKSRGKKVDFSFGSTGLLAKQIEDGAPFDVFAGANVSFIDEAVASGACDEETKKLYARGRIVLWAKDQDALPKKLEDLSDAKYGKIAIANPEHAPYGLAGKQALTSLGLWSNVSPRAVYGENIQQTLMFGQSGNAEVAIVALSLAVVSQGAYLPIDPALHAPLDQALVVCKGGKKGPKLNEAKAFVDFVSSSEGRAIMTKYGFLLPGESLPSK